jgi:hypothetical protein
MSAGKTLQIGRIKSAKWHETATSGRIIPETSSNRRGMDRVLLGNAA